LTKGEGPIMSLPLVSVVVPTHNRPAMLAEALASVRAQTYADYEIIVVSNGESDDMRRQSHDVAMAHDCRYFALPDGNLPAARNFGTEHAKGEWIAFLDDDDLWLPRKLERQLDEARRVDADMISCGPPLEGWSYRDSGQPQLFLKLASHDHAWATPSSIMVRKRAIKEAGGFDSRQRYCEDIDLWRRISWSFAIHHMDDFLIQVRAGHDRMSSRSSTLYLYSLRHLIKMYIDTPAHLRWALPSITLFVLHRVAIILAPRWLLRLRPRQRLIRWASMRVEREDKGM